MSRITGALIDWTARYPGDLADDVTQSMFREMLAMILRHTFMAHLAADLVQIEQSLYSAVDIDRSWGLSAPATSNLNVDDSLPSATSTELVIDNDVLYDFESIVGTSESERPGKESTPSSKSISTSSLGLGLEAESAAVIHHARRRSGSDPRLLDGYAVEERSEDVGFARWSHAFAFVINSDPRMFAVELTRMQWSLFVQIRVGFPASVVSGRSSVLIFSAARRAAT
jgi:hypothetical protein